MFKRCYQVRALMLKAKIWPKTTKSNHGRVRVKASRQREFSMPKKI